VETELNTSKWAAMFLRSAAARLTIDARWQDFKGYDLASDICNVEASGGSDIQVTVKRAFCKCKWWRCVL
jgi:hypothetical protein